MLLSHFLLALVWIIYCVLHSVLAGVGFKRLVQQRTGKAFRYYRLFYTLFAFASLIGVIYFQLSLTTANLFTPGLMTKLCGGLVAGTGLVLMLICIRKYFLSLSGLKSLYIETPSAELMVAGIHRYMRHPLYTGTFLFIWGLWLMLPSATLLIADVIITSYTLLAIRLEEAKLVAEYGEKYLAYQKSVPRLIPRL